MGILFFGCKFWLGLFSDKLFEKGASVYRKDAHAMVL